jgi:hypothetical protein
VTPIRYAPVSFTQIVINTDKRIRGCHLSIKSIKFNNENGIAIKTCPRTKYAQL